MAQICITVPDGTEPRIVAGIIAAHRTVPKEPGETNPQFARRMTRRWWQHMVFRLEGGDAALAARNAVVNDPTDPFNVEP